MEKIIMDLDEIINLCEEKIGKVIYDLLEKNGYFTLSLSEKDKKTQIEKIIQEVSKNKIVPNFVKTQMPEISKILKGLNFEEIAKNQKARFKKILLNEV